VIRELRRRQERQIDMNRTSSRVAPVLAAVLASVLLVAACGNSDESGSPVDRPSDTTTDTTSPDDNDGMRAPTPIEVVSGGGGGGGGAVAAAESADGSKMASDMMIAPWIVEYVIGDGMPALPTADTGYVFDSLAEVTPDQVSAIAASLGVTGEPVRIDEGYGVSWRVGPEDGSAPSVWVYDDGQQNWSYNSAWATDGGDAVACSISVDSEGNESSDCPEPEPPVGVPTAADAEQRATEVLSALGVDPATVEFETYADEWSASVNVSDRSDARAPIRSWYFGFGAEGVLQYAGGALATPAPVGPYPLIDLETAVARLSGGFYGFGGGFGGGIAVAEPALAREAESVLVDPAETPVDDTGGTPGVEPLPVEELPPESLPAPEPVVVTLVDVQADLWWAWDADGTAWLLPAYRFIDTDGGWHVVPAVTDEFLIQADPGVVPEPLPVETVPVETVPVETVPPETVPVDTVPSETVPVETVPVETVPVDPAVETANALALLEPLVGLALAEFTDQATALGFETRVTAQDGEALAVTLDFRTDRVNVAVEGEVVVGIDSIG
jgi:hypothetical protein